MRAPRPVEPSIVREKGSARLAAHQNRTPAHLHELFGLGTTLCDAQIDDTQSPVLEAFDFTPSAIDVTSGFAEVGMTAGLHVL